MASEHPDTDPFLAEGEPLPPTEEARRPVLRPGGAAEMWRRASRLEQAVVHRLAPLGITAILDTLVHPGVYKTVGLDGWATWQRVRATPERLAVRHRQPGRCSPRSSMPVWCVPAVPMSWQRLSAVDTAGVPTT